MFPTLKECNEALDWVEENFDLGDDFRIHVHDEDGMLFLDVVCFQFEAPTASELYPPVGWIMATWWRIKDGAWRTSITRGR